MYYRLPRREALDRLRVRSKIFLFVKMTSIAAMHRRTISMQHKWKLINGSCSAKRHNSWLTNDEERRRRSAVKEQQFECRQAITTDETTSSIKVVR